jgi:hypothetical protein
VFVVALAVIVWARRGWRLGHLTVAAIVLTTGVSLFIAGDLSRSLAVLMPACLSGMLLMWDRRERSFFADAAAVAVAVLSFVLPARHVVTSFEIPIRGVAHELHEWRRPPAVVNAHAYLRAADAAMHDHAPAAATHFVDGALALDRSPVTSPPASLHPSELTAARQLLDDVLAANPTSREARYLRGLLEARRGNEAAAVADLRQALEPATGD